MTPEVPARANAIAMMRSKNAGPFQLAVDVIFEDRDAYDRAKAVLRPEAIATRYGIAGEDVLAVHFWESALSIKVVFRRRVSAGAPGDTDCYGAQQHGPLLDLLVEATP